MLRLVKWWTDRPFRVRQERRCLQVLGAVIELTAGRMTLGDEVIYADGWKVRPAPYGVTRSVSFSRRRT
jgi:hypothetical protein